MNERMNDVYIDARTQASHTHVDMVSTCIDRCPHASIYARIEEMECRNGMHLYMLIEEMEGNGCTQAFVHKHTYTYTYEVFFHVYTHTYAHVCTHVVSVRVFRIIVAFGFVRPQQM